MRHVKRSLLAIILIVSVLLLLAVTVSAACDTHTPDAGTVTLEPNCNTIGIITYNCQVCGEEYTQKMGNLGHNYEDGICIRCGEADPDAAIGTGTQSSAGSATVTTTSPKTGDAFAPLLWTVVLSASMFGVCVIRRRVHN